MFTSERRGPRASSPSVNFEHEHARPFTSTLPASASTPALPLRPHSVLSRVPPVAAGRHVPRPPPPADIEAKLRAFVERLDIRPMVGPQSELLANATAPIGLLAMPAGPRSDELLATLPDDEMTPAPTAAAVEG